MGFIDNLLNIKKVRAALTVVFALALMSCAVILALLSGGSEVTGLSSDGKEGTESMPFGSNDKNKNDGDIFNNKDAKMLGGTVCDYMNYEIWSTSWEKGVLMKRLKENGFNWVRVGVQMKDSPELENNDILKWNTFPWRDLYWSSVQYASAILKDADKAGMKKNLFFFLSDTNASGAAQNAPASWSGLTADQTAENLKEYCYETTKYFMDKGIEIDMYDIGNEIERGILNFRPDERIERPADVNILSNMDWMRSNIWNIEAKLLISAIDGVRKADPDAKICLHASCLARGGDNTLLKGFFKAMVDFEVPFDVMGVSYYWSDIHSDYVDIRTAKEAYYTTQEWKDTLAYLTTLGKKFIFSEFQYPQSPDGIDAAPDIGYPYTPEGQEKWIKDFLRYVKDTPEVSGALYFYPDYFPGVSSFVNLNSCGLFSASGIPAPALKWFKN